MAVFVATSYIHHVFTWDVYSVFTMDMISYRTIYSLHGSTFRSAFMHEYMNVYICIHTSSPTPNRNPIKALAINPSHSFIPTLPCSVRSCHPLRLCAYVYVHIDSSQLAPLSQCRFCIPRSFLLLVTSVGIEVEHCASRQPGGVQGNWAGLGCVLNSMLGDDMWYDWHG